MKASNFKYKKNHPFTRRKYMGGVPGSKIVKFTMGNTSRDYTHRLELINIKYATTPLSLQGSQQIECLKATWVERTLC